MHTRLRFAALALVATLALLVGCESSPGGGGGSTQPFALVVTAFPTSVQSTVGFGVTLERRDATTGGPAAIGANTNVTVSNTGAGTLGGTTTQAMTAGSATVTFTGLTLSGTGAVTLTFAMSDPDTSGASQMATVLLPYTLVFTSVPTTVVEPASFSVTVQVQDASSGAPVTPAPPLNISLSSNGTGTLSGTTTRTTAGANLTFTSLSYNTLENATLRATATDVPSADSSSIGFDRANVSLTSTTPNPALVNGTFSLSMDFTSQLNPPNALSVSNLNVDVTATTGSGTLTGGGSSTANGTSHTVTGLSYDAWETFTIQAQTAHDSDTMSVPTEVDLDGPAGPVVFTGGSSPGAQNYTVRDGNGTAYAITSSVDWTITQGASTVQSGNVALTAQSTFSITPGALASGTYTMTATVTGHPLATHSHGLTTAVVVNGPGPVAMLKSGRVNASYSETVSGFVSSATGYSLASGSMPTGTNLNPTTGAITGTPTTTGVHTFVVHATVSGGVTPIRCTLPIFSSNDTEWVSGQNFASGTPPYTGTFTDVSGLTVTNTFDSATPTFAIRIFYPSQIGSISTPMPLLIHHHGRGFDHDDYDIVMTRIAAWGFIIVSSGDYYSFYGGSEPGYSGPHPYEFSWYTQGMQSASGTQEALIRYMMIRNRTSGDTFEGKINEDRIFCSGHSRGGGATHASQTRGLDFVASASAPAIPATERYGIAGVIMLMPFDLWYDSGVHPPSTPSGPGPGYSIPRDLNRIPALIFSSEEDGDLSYPFCDQMIERRVAATAFVTIWGGNHNYTGDTNGNEGSPSISRATQHNIVVQWMTAFLTRYGYDRLDLEGHLFGDEYDQSSQVGHVSWRDMPTAIMVDDAQNGSVGTNTLGFANTALGITTSLTYPYPSIGSLSAANPRSVRLSWGSTGTSSYQTVVGNVGSPLDATDARRLVFEIRQDGSTGFNWATIDVRLTDTTGGNTAVRIYDRSGPSSSYLPVHPIPGHSSTRWLDRFVKVEIPLTAFSGVNLASLANIRFEFNINSTTRDILLDDIRFE